MKAKIEPKQVDVEALNQKANDLAKDSTPEQAAIVKEPMSSVNKRWDNLLEGLGDREVMYLHFFSYNICKRILYGRNICKLQKYLH